MVVCTLRRLAGWLAGFPCLSRDIVGVITLDASVIASSGHDLVNPHRDKPLTCVKRIPLKAHLADWPIAAES